MAALADQVQVELADRRQEAVRVLDRDLARLAVVDLEAVRERQLGAIDDALEDPARVDLLEVDRVAGGGQGTDRGGGGAERADHDAAVGGVRAQHVMRGRMLAADDALEVGSSGQGHGRSVTTRWGSC